MTIFPEIYKSISKLYRYDTVKRLKSKLRPLKHALFGKSGIYQALDIVKDLKAKEGGQVLTVFDVGAAVGDTTETFLISFPQATVYCFEPLPSSYARLLKRLSRYGSRVKSFNFALFNKNSEEEFYEETDADGSSFSPPLNDSSNQKKVIKVTSRTLDSVVKDLGITKIDFMKIDVEGAEKEVLQGGKNTLKITANVFVEILPLRRGPYSRTYLDTLEILHEAGFSWLGVYGDFFFTKLL